MKAKKNLVNSLLDCAVEYGLTNSNNYKYLKGIMDTYSSTGYAGKADFNSTHDSAQVNRQIEARNNTVLATAAGGMLGYAAVVKGCTIAGTAVTPGVGTAVGAVAGLVIGGAYCLYTELDNKTDNEVIDDCMQALYKEIKAKMTQQV